MCGIAGFIKAKPTVGGHRMVEILHDLGHRGPDGSGLYESPHATLGAVRLSIVDLARGAQPVVFEHPKIVVVLNGEIYNHAALRSKLHNLGHRFSSNCDTETVLHAFLEWKTDAFRRLHGMFAIAIWQEDKRRLYLVRDRMGIKPLYFSQVRADLYFGSELKALFGHDAIKRKINLSALQHYLSFNYVPGPETLIEGIEKLTPGSWLEWKDGVIKRHEYWKLESKALSSCSLDVAGSQLDSLLQQSVREHRMGDVPVGVWVSGGLDSSAILHYLAESSGERIKTFSVTFDGRSFDEAGDSRLAARHYGTEHREMDIHPGLDLADVIEQMVFYSDEPNADAGAVPLWFLSRMTAGSVKVVLSGDGGDELFAGYQTYAADALRKRLRKVPAPLLNFGHRLAGLLPVGDDKIGFQYRALRFLEGCSLSPIQAHLSWNGTFSEQEKQELYCRYQPDAAHTFLRTAPAHASNSHWLQQVLLLDQKIYLADNILAKCDRMSMAHSLEVRPPFLDHRIVEFANSLPPDMKLQRGASKVILRHLLRDKLPLALLKKKKVGLDIPVHDWLRTILRPLLLDCFASQSIRSSGLFREAKIHALLREHLGHKRNVGYHLWGLLILALWIKKWRIQIEPESDVKFLDSRVSTTRILSTVEL